MAIEDYLEQRPKALATYKANKGGEFILKAAEMANCNTFDYYYNRMKKMSLMRAYENMGMDLSWLYDPDEIMNVKRKQEQEDWLDNASLVDIYNRINDKIDAIKEVYVDEMDDSSCDLGKGIDEHIDSYAETPAVGYPLYDIYLSTTTRGARLGKFYLRSAATNVGKTRYMIADACYMGCYQMYDIKEHKWVSTGEAQPVLFIATEQQLDEIQDSAVAFLAGDESSYITGQVISVDGGM